MHDRITLGFAADVAETAAPTMTDTRATERIYDACDGIQEESDWFCEMHNVSETVRYHLGNECVKVAYAYFHRRPWRKTGMRKPTFYKRLKIFLISENIGRKRHHAARKSSQK